MEIPPGIAPEPYVPPPLDEPISWTEAWTKALFSPSEATFRRIGYNSNASFWRAAVWIFVASLIGLFISVPLMLVFNPAQIDQLRQAVGMDGSPLMAALGLMACFVPFSAFFSVVGAAIGVGLYQLIARLLGGEGDFNALFNASAAFIAPLGIVASIASAIPLAGACISGVLGIYHLVLEVIAIQAVNRFGYGKAILTLLIPLFVVGLCCCLVFMLFGASLAPLLGDPAQWEQFLTPMP